ncbi:response regulator transcription factor [Desulfatiferula olefinivorans]
MTRRILVIDDDAILQQLLADYLTAQQYDVTSSLTGGEGLAVLTASPDPAFDLVVLDIMLPDLDGFETLRRIRTLSAVPVIMLTARNDETDRIIGLEMGADDYMHKPFNPRELLARIKAVLRRSGPATGPADDLHREIVQIGPFTLDPAKGKLFRDGRDIPLSGVEFDILKELAMNPGRPLSRDHLLNIARGRDFEAFDRSIDVHISRIRKKIEDRPARPVFIKTVWGRGYAWGETPLS